VKIKKKAKSIETVRAKRIVDALKKSDELSAASIARATNLRFRPATKTLGALVKRGIITSRVEPSGERKTPPRVFYRLNQNTPTETIQD